MVTQTDYSHDDPALELGRIATGEAYNVISGTADEAIGFGKIVAQGSTDDNVKLCDAANDVPLGIAMATTVQEGLISDGYAQYDTVSVVQRGTVAVNAGAAVDAGDEVIFNDSGVIGLGTNKFSQTAVYVDSASGADELVRIRLS